MFCQACGAQTRILAPRSRYGEIVEVWFDGSNVIEVGDILKKHAPRAMVFQGPHATIRWVGNEAGFAHLHHRPVVVDHDRHRTVEYRTMGDHVVQTVLGQQLGLLGSEEDLAGVLDGAAGLEVVDFVATRLPGDRPTEDS